jgi:hypothetical protein
MNGMMDDMNFKNEWEDFKKEYGTEEVGDLLAWRILKMEKSIQKRFEEIEAKQDRLLIRLWQSLPTYVKGPVILAILTAAGFQIYGSF